MMCSGTQLQKAECKESRCHGGKLFRRTDLEHHQMTPHMQALRRRLRRGKGVEQLSLEQDTDLRTTRVLERC